MMFLAFPLSRGCMIFKMFVFADGVIERAARSKLGIGLITPGMQLTDGRTNGG